MLSDSADEDGVRQLLRQIELTDHEELHIVLGMVKDKDVSGVLSLLPAQAHYYFTRAQIPRALPEQERSLAGNVDTAFASSAPGPA